MTELTRQSYQIPAADIGPENPLPIFRGRKEDGEVKAGPGLTEDERRFLGWKTASRVLPYRMQDGYNRVKTPHAFDSLVLENEFLRAILLPELGGRLVSLYDKEHNRELLARNPVFQPANLALRNAWFAGGIEWNTCLLGHYYHTCSPVFAGRIRGSQGEPALRIWEWDRVKRFPYQIDLHLPPGSRFLFARVRLINPHQDEIPMYWWTNMGVMQSSDVRVLCPADSAITGTKRGLDAVSLPAPSGHDITYTTNAPSAGEFFMRIPEGERRWIAALDGQGKGFVQTSTDRLRGRKLFFFGMNQGGRRWQDFLAEPGWAYLEIQAGLARTQLESVPMPAGAEWCWTEGFGYLEADPRDVHSPDWTLARTRTEAALEAILPRAKVEEWDRTFADVTETPPEEVLFAGSGWGALEKRRAAAFRERDTFPPELPFPASSMGEDQAPWLALLDQGELPERNPSDGPGQYMTQPEWMELLEQSLNGGQSRHWLGWLHLGVMRREALDMGGARLAWEHSVMRRLTSWAVRNLAMMKLRKKRTQETADLLRVAWDIGPRCVQLAVEVAACLLQLEHHQELREFASGLEPEFAANERIRIMSAKAALETGEIKELEELLSQEFTSVREGEVILTDLWFALQEHRLSALEGVPIDERLKERVRQEFPPPANIDFRMSV